MGKEATIETNGDQVSYKPSRYNHFFPTEEGYYLAYNAFSNSFAKVPTNNYEKICRILENPDNNTCKDHEYTKLKCLWGRCFETWILQGRSWQFVAHST